MRITDTFASWLTARRVRAHAVILLVAIWSVYAYDMSAPGLLDRYGLVKGPDFLPFYTLGKLALAHRGDLLYDMGAQAALRQQIVPGSSPFAYLPFYGPQAALLFAVFATLAYAKALAAWLLLSVFIYAACCYLVWKRCPALSRRGATVMIAAAAFPGFFHLVTFAQSSALPLLFFTLTFLALSGNRHFLAGLAFGCMVFKPHFALVGAILFLLFQNWTVIAGALASAAAQLSVGWLAYGTSAMQSYIHTLLHAGDVPTVLEPKLYQSFSLRGFWWLLIPADKVADVVYVASAVAILWITIRIWKNTTAVDLRFSALLLASILVAPHANAYDLVMLAPAFLLLTNFVLPSDDGGQNAMIKSTLYLCFPLFLLLPLTRVIHLQLGTIAMAGLLWLIYKVSVSSPCVAKKYDIADVAR